MSPACEAVIVQEPTPVRCTVTPPTAQFPLAANDTGRPELENAETTKSGSPNVFVSSGGKKVIDWRTLAIVNVRETSGAGLKFRPPGCDAVTVQEPPRVM